MKKAFLLILASLFLSEVAAIAQMDPDLEDSTKKSRTIRFICMADHMPQYFYDSRKSESIEIGSAIGSLSLPHPMPSDRVLEIYRKVLPPPDAPAGTKTLKQILATAKIPTGFSKAIVLLLPGGDAETGSLRIAAFGDSYRLHPKETIRVFNLAPWEISMKVGPFTNRYKPGQDGVMPWKGGDQDVVVFQTWVNKDDEWRVVGINELATRPNLRAFMFASKGIPVISSRICFDAVPD